jgi:hypothetical protein
MSVVDVGFANISMAVFRTIIVEQYIICDVIVVTKTLPVSNAFYHFEKITCSPNVVA